MFVVAVAVYWHNSKGGAGFGLLFTFCSLSDRRRSDSPIKLDVDGKSMLVGGDPDDSVELSCVGL